MRLVDSYGKVLKRIALNDLPSFINSFCVDAMLRGVDAILLCDCFPQSLNNKCDFFRFYPCIGLHSAIVSNIASFYSYYKDSVLNIFHWIVA